MIPEAAVEAALLASRQPDNWMRLEDEALVRTLLEAAAPHMLAGVADEREGDLFRFTLAQREWLRGGAR